MYIQARRVFHLHLFSWFALGLIGFELIYLHVWGYGPTVTLKGWPFAVAGDFFWGPNALRPLASWIANLAFSVIVLTSTALSFEKWYCGWEQRVQFRMASLLWAMFVIAGTISFLRMEGYIYTMFAKHYDLLYCGTSYYPWYLESIMVFGVVCTISATGYILYLGCYVVCWSNKYFGDRKKKTSK